MNCCNNCGSATPYYGTCGCCQSSSSSSCGTSQDYTPYLSGDFTAPSVNGSATIKVTSSAGLYKGQGISVGGGYYQIGAILSETEITIINGGLGATPGSTVKAKNTSTNCYQWPIIPAGFVPISFTVEDFGGFDNSGVEIAGSWTPLTVITANYGYVGPDRVRVNFDGYATTSSTPRLLGVKAPITPKSGASQALIPAYVSEGAGPLVTVAGINPAFPDPTFIYAKKSTDTNFTNGTNRAFSFSGDYQVDL